MNSKEEIHCFTVDDDFYLYLYSIPRLGEILIYKGREYKVDSVIHFILSSGDVSIQLKLRENK